MAGCRIETGSKHKVTRSEVLRFSRLPLQPEGMAGSHFLEDGVLGLNERRVAALAVKSAHGLRKDGLRGN